MKPYTAGLAVLAALTAGGMAHAQTSSNSGGTTTMSPAASPTTQPATPPTAVPQTPATTQGTPAEGSASGRASTMPPAVTTRGAADSHTRNPAPGANSFTAGEARRRLEAAGYRNVTDLKKDDQGIWRARAQHNGQQVAVALDYRGSISAGH